jgi:hypothetical protein
MNGARRGRRCTEQKLPDSRRSAEASPPGGGPTALQGRSRASAVSSTASGAISVTGCPRERGMMPPAIHPLHGPQEIGLGHRSRCLHAEALGVLTNTTNEPGGCSSTISRGSRLPSKGCPNQTAQFGGRPSDAGASQSLTIILVAFSKSKPVLSTSPSPSARIKNANWSESPAFFAPARRRHASIEFFAGLADPALRLEPSLLELSAVPHATIVKPMTTHATTRGELLSILLTCCTPPSLWLQGFHDDRRNPDTDSARTRWQYR